MSKKRVLHRKKTRKSSADPGSVESGTDTARTLRRRTKRARGADPVRTPSETSGRVTVHEASAPGGLAGVKADNKRKADNKKQKDARGKGRFAALSGHVKGFKNGLAKLGRRIGKTKLVKKTRQRIKKIDKKLSRFQSYRLAKELVRGATADTFKHTVEGIRRNPLKFAAAVAGVGLVSAASTLIAVNPEIPALLFTGVALARGAAQGIRAIRQAATPEEKARLVGSSMVGPSLIALGALGLGRLVQGDHGAAAHAPPPAAGSSHGAAAHAGPTASGLAKAGAVGMIVGGDSPLIFFGASADH